MKRTVIGIIFISSLILPFAVVYIFFSHQIYQIKEEVKLKIKAGLTKEDLVLLVFSKEESETQLRWEHDREFEYKGQMYDIVSLEIKSDSIFYLCYWDHKETRAKQTLKKLKSKSPEKDRDFKERNQKNIENSINLFYVEAPLLTNISNFQKRKVGWYIFNLSNIFYPPPFPPPQGC